MSFHSSSITRLSLLCFLLFCGCSQPEPLERQIKAASEDEFVNWRNQNDGDLGPSLRKDFDTAIQELKLEAMDKGAGSISKRGDATRAEINGKRLREILILGWQARRARMEEELKDMQQRYDHDSRLKARPDDADSAQFLSNVTRNETDLIAQRHASIIEADSKLEEWSERSATKTAQVP